MSKKWTVDDARQVLEMNTVPSQFAEVEELARKIDWFADTIDTEATFEYTSTPGVGMIPVEVRDFTMRMRDEADKMRDAAQVIAALRNGNIGG